MMEEEKEEKPDSVFETLTRYAFVFGAGFLGGWIFNVKVGKIPNPSCVLTQKQVYTELIKMPVDITSATFQLQFFKREDGRWGQ